MLMSRPNTQAISPFFIVSNVDQTIGFYRDKLGFETRWDGNRATIVAGDKERGHPFDTRSSQTS